MTITNAQIAGAIEQYAPLSLQEPWDNSGWQLGNPFAACTGRSAETDWEKQLREKLTNHLPVFAGLVSSEHEDISYFSQRIVEELTGKER
jgi:putative NIF3 family GTP cyclohydrolase 1 type 2